MHLESYPDLLRIKPVTFLKIKKGRPFKTAFVVDGGVFKPEKLIL
jgi:hypothetical protein